MSKKNIGVLALQGDFQEHGQALDKIGVNKVEVRLPKDLEGLDALIFPGGESTTILKLMVMYDLYDKIKEMGKNGMPMYGTCAGTIVLSRKSDRLKVDTLDLIDIEVERNSYGSQKHSFEEDISIKGIDKKVPGIFIRAPRILKVGSGVEILGKTKSDDVVIARQNNILVSTFHPELSESADVHDYFVNNFVKS